MRKRERESNLNPLKRASFLVTFGRNKFPEIIPIIANTAVMSNFNKTDPKINFSLKINPFATKPIKLFRMQP